MLDEQDAGFGGDVNLTIYVPLSTGYRNLFNARAAGSTDERVSNIRVSVTNVDDTAAVTAEIESILRDRHRIDVGEDDDFSVIDQQMGGWKDPPLFTAVQEESRFLVTSIQLELPNMVNTLS